MRSQNLSSVMVKKTKVYLFGTFEKLRNLCNGILAVRKLNSQAYNNILALHFSAFFATLREYNPFYEKVNRSNRYWIRQSLPEVLEDADRLFSEENYVEVYELLNRLRFNTNVDVQWRICRALYKMSCNTTLSSSVRSEMIQEAYDLISSTMHIGQDNPNVHKWMAVITDAKRGTEGTISRVKSLNTVKAHLIRAAELNPNDVSVLYMLGQWCFNVSNFSWYQRKISSVFFTEPPTSTYEEAYDYFWRAEELKPRFYLPNLYMLGRTSFYMKQYFRARYYLYLAAHLPPRTNFEKECASEAKVLANDLQQFDVAKDALLYGLSGSSS